MRKGWPFGVGPVAFLLLFWLFAAEAVAQDSGLAVRSLIEMGYENVSCTETESERVYVVQNTTYRLESVGAVNAVDLIQRMGMPEDKDCRIVVMDNNVPQISLVYHRSDSQAYNGAAEKTDRSGWEATYDLGENWSEARKTQRQNRSFGKVDIVVYPQLMFRNYVINRVYDYVVNLNPTIEVSLWDGLKLTAQIIVPIHNDYGYVYKKVRPGYLTISQSFRFENLFLTASFGNFNRFHWGMNLSGKYVFSKNTHFVLDGEIGYYGISHFDGFKMLEHDVDRSLNQLTFSVGGSYFWKKYNTQFKLHFEQYLRSEKGLRFTMVRHFRKASIGFYAVKVEHGGHHGINAGFTFMISLPPYKNKRHGYIPRINTSDYWGLTYNAGNENIYGLSVNPRVDNNIASENSFNPILINSELFNY